MGLFGDEYEEDPRFLMSSPYPLITIIAMYLWFCIKAGPHFMRNREPFQLKKVLIGYNLFQVIVNTYIVIQALRNLHNFSFTCQPIADASTPFGRFIIFGSYTVFLVKITELIDTILFVLRKKYNQVSALHLYHHAMVPLMGWLANKYFPGGNYWFVGVLNMTVHAVMYTYYLIAALGPQYKKYLWWKQYITIFQMVQFVLALIHGVQTLFRECNYPKPMMVLICFQSILFLKMFGQFYIDTYINPKISEKMLKKERGALQHQLDCSN